MAETCCASTTKRTATTRVTGTPRSGSISAPARGLRTARSIRRLARAAALGVVALRIDSAFAQPAPAVDEGGAASSGSSFSFERLAADGVPDGWSLGEGAVVDDGISHDGERSLRLRAGDGRDARATLRLPPPRVDGNRIRFALRARAGEGAEALELFLRIDGPDGLLYVDRRAVPIETSAGGEWQQVVMNAPVFAAAESLRFSIAVERGTAWIDAFALEGASTAELPPPSASARRYVEYALGLIDSHSIYRTALDWPAFRRAVLEQARGATTPAEAHMAVRYALGALGDVHGYLRAPDRAAQLGRAPVSNARTGRPPIAPEGSRLPGGIGYLTVPGFAGGTHMQQVEFAEKLQTLIAALDEEPSGACGWIVDLRSNSGGNLWPMLLGLGPLLGDGDVVFATYPDGRRDTVWYRDGKAGLGDYARLRVRGAAHRLRDPDARIAILFGPDTASAGEVLAMAFQGVVGRRSFGSPTGGVNTGTRTFVLSDGAELVLAVVTMSDRTGRAYRGPLAPDAAVASGRRDTPLPEQSEVRAALGWLAQGC